MWNFSINESLIIKYSWKHCCKKGKLVIMINFSFCHNVFKSRLLQMRQNVSTRWEKVNTTFDLSEICEMCVPLSSLSKCYKIVWSLTMRLNLELLFIKSVLLPGGNGVFTNTSCIFLTFSHIKQIGCRQLWKCLLKHLENPFVGLITKKAEIIVANEKISHHQHFQLWPHCFQMSSAAFVSKCVCRCKGVKKWV